MIKDNQNYNDNVEPNSEFLNELKNKLPEYFNKNGEFDLDKFKNNLKANNINELKDGYQLDFIGKDYARRQSGERPTTVIVPDNQQNNGEGKNSNNLFFTGDNIEVLRHLQGSYTNKINVIYIDPPYNTGNNDFVYPDNFEYSDEEIKRIFNMDDEQLNRLKSIQGKSGHSAWLTFMYPRIVLAKKLLSNNGCIFISIDENEDSNLKNLLNELFGENNFIGQVVRKTRSSANDPSTGFNQQHEFLYIYAKNINDFKLIGEQKTFEQYKNPDNDPKGDWKTTDPSARSGSDDMLYEIVNPYTNQKDFPPKGRYWAFSKSTMKKWIQSGKFVFKKEYDDKYRGFYIKKYVSELRSTNNQVNSLFATDNSYMNQYATRYLRDDIFNGENLFTSPKPVEFIQKLIKYSTKEDAIVLDFFAGSSTTAEAVMRANAEDGKNRKYIMVQLQEKTYKINNNGTETPTKGGEAAYKLGYKSIDEISRKRISLASKNINDIKDNSFKHYIVTNPDVKTLDEIDDFNSNNVTLFNDMLDNFSSNNLGLDLKINASGKETIFNTWLMKDGYFGNSMIDTVCFDKYKANIVNDDALYLIDKNWTSNCTRDLLNKLGQYELNINKIVLFGYSFNIAETKELEIGLKQLDMNVNLLKRY